MKRSQPVDFHFIALSKRQPQLLYKCQLFATLDGNYGAPYISDHYPIAMVFTL